MQICNAICLKTYVCKLYRPRTPYQDIHTFCALIGSRLLLIRRDCVTFFVPGMRHVGPLAKGSVGLQTVPKSLFLPELVVGNLTLCFSRVGLLYTGELYVTKYLEVQREMNDLPGTAQVF